MTTEQMAQVVDPALNDYLRLMAAMPPDVFRVIAQVG